MRRERKCYCTAKLRVDGTCPYACDPALRAPGKRRRTVEKHERQRVDFSHRGFVTIEEGREGIKRAIPDAVARDLTNSSWWVRMRRSTKKAQASET